MLNLNFKQRRSKRTSDSFSGKRLIENKFLTSSLSRASLFAFISISACQSTNQNREGILLDPLKMDKLVKTVGAVENTYELSETVIHAGITAVPQKQTSINIKKSPSSIVKNSAQINSTSNSEDDDSADSGELGESDEPIVDENLKADSEKEVIDKDSEKSPEEIGELIPESNSIIQSIEGKFPLCEDSIYMADWRRQFEARWLAANTNRYKKQSLLRRALSEARSQEFMRLLFPVLDVSSFDYPVVINDDVLKWMNYFQTRGRKVFVTWLRRAEDIVPLMAPVLEKNGLPKDLVYLSMIESGFNNRAFSSARASGPWQFMSATGKKFNLRITDFVDERRDPVKATQAAVDYLTYLYSLFGDWHLAAASYNAGEGRVGKAIRAADAADFFTLSEGGFLPNETRNYVPKLIAAMIISKNPTKFGFEVSAGSRAIKTKTLKLERSVALSDLSRAINIDKSVIEGLNPELRLGITPPSTSKNKSYNVVVPENVYADAVAAIGDLPEPSLYHPVVARVRRRESVTQFAQHYGLTTQSILKSNPSLKANSKLNKGQTLTLSVALGSGQYERLTSDQGKSKKKIAKRGSRKNNRKYARVSIRRSAKNTVNKD